MTGTGSWQRALELRADTANPDRIHYIAREWEKAGRALTAAADALDRHAADADLIGGRSGPAIHETLRATAERMRERAESVEKGAAALAQVQRAVLTARGGRGSGERRARELVEAVDIEFRKAAAVMAEIRGHSPLGSGPADPTSNPGDPPAVRAAPQTVRTDVVESGRPITPQLPIGLDVETAPHWPDPERPAVVTEAPAVLGAPEPVTAGPSPAALAAGVIGAVVAGGIRARLVGPGTVPSSRTPAAPTVRPIGGLAGGAAAVAPLLPVGALPGRRGAATSRRGGAAAAVGPAGRRRTRDKRRAKRIRSRTRRIGRHRREEREMGKDA